MGLEKDLSEEKLVEIEGMLKTRFLMYQSNRKSFDDAIQAEVEIAENKDYTLESIEEWKKQVNVNYLYSVIQTITARLTSSIFGHQDWLKVFAEDNNWREYQNKITHWMQEEMDREGLKYSSRDFFEDSLKKRVSFIQLRPVPIEKHNNDKKEWKFGLELLDFFDVYFDTKAMRVMDTDWFLSKKRKYHEVMRQKSIYFGLDEIQFTNYDLLDDPEKHDEYQARHRGADKVEVSYYTDTGGEDKPVELMEWYGVLDLSEMSPRDEDYEPEYKECIVTLANRQKIIRIEENDLELDRPRLIFPIRPLRQARSIIGKSIPQICGTLPHELNTIKSLTLENYEQLVKLVWKYKKTSDIDLEELFSGGGNAIGVEEMDDVQLFETKDLLNQGLGMMQSVMNFMQMITGAVSSSQGISAAGTQTASEVRTNTEQAMFKFNMMADNCALDLTEMINYYMILALKYNTGVLMRRYPEIMDIFKDADIRSLEHGFKLDVAIKDLTQRKDVEQNQWANMVGVILPLLQQAGGNTTELLSRLFEVFNIHNTNALLEPERPDQIAMKLFNNPQLSQAVMQMLAQLTEQNGGGSGASGAGGGASARTGGSEPQGGSPEERAASENLDTGAGPG